MWFTPLLQGGAQQQQAGGGGVYRPSSDITVTGWIGVPDNVNLYNNIDETSASDTDYVVSPSLAATPGPAIFGLNGTLSAGSCIVRFRASYGGTSGQLRALLQDASGVTVGTTSWQVLTNSAALYELPVTISANAERIRLEVQEGGGSLYLDGSLLYLDTDELSLNGPSTSLPVGALYLDTNLLYLDSNIVSLT